MCRFAGNTEDRFSRVAAHMVHTLVVLGYLENYIGMAFSLLH